MQDYYRINVSKDGRYMFATEQCGICYREDAEKVYNLFLEKFPKEDGYKVSMTYWQSRGQHIYG